MKVKITTLCENTAKQGYLAEWGLSMLVEADGMMILMDTGSSFTALHNAEKMNLDLSNIDCVFLSHGDDDHTGGLLDVLKQKSDLKIIAHPDVWDQKYTLRDGESQIRFTGIPFTRQQLEAAGARFTLTSKSVHIGANLITTGEIPMVTDYEKIEDNLLVKESGDFRPDGFADDGALIVNADYGLVIVAGCAHRGIINTIYHAQDITGKKDVYAVIGGIHLYRASEERIEKTIEALKLAGVQKIGVSHCTGFKAAARIAREFGDKFFLNNAGGSFELP